MNRGRFANAIFCVDWDLGVAAGWMNKRAKALRAGDEAMADSSLIMAIGALESAKDCLREAERLPKRSAKKGGRS